MDVLLFFFSLCNNDLFFFLDFDDDDLDEFLLLLLAVNIPDGFVSLFEVDVDSASAFSFIPRDDDDDATSSTVSKANHSFGNVAMTAVVGQTIDGSLDCDSCSNNFASSSSGGTCDPG